MQNSKFPKMGIEHYIIQPTNSSGNNVRKKVCLSRNKNPKTCMSASQNIKVRNSRMSEVNFHIIQSKLCFLQY